MRLVSLAAVALVAVAFNPGVVQAQHGGPPTAAAHRQQNPDNEKETKRCAEMSEEERRATLRCQTEEERREDEYARIQAEREERERPTRTSFLKWIHVDGLWIANNVGLKSYGLIGTHVAVMEVGRLQFYGPPGVMLIMDRDGDSWRARPGLTWGFSLRLTDARLPGTQKNVGLFLNLAKVWTTGSVRSGRDMIGFSMTLGD